MMREMQPFTGPIIAMIIGVVGSSVIHLSKGVMRLGVTRLQEKQGAGKAIYVAGMVMNFTNPFWVMVANRFAPTLYYTSVYGVGLIPLLLFSCAVLGERLDARQILGVMLVGVATVLVGVVNVAVPSPSLFAANQALILVVAASWLLLGPLLLAGVRNTTVLLQGLFFGLIGGGFAALDAMMKGLAQSGAAGSTLLPQGGIAWLVFLLSFLGAGGAFVIIQWSYVRGCRASVMGSAYDVSYVALPLLLTTVAVPGARFSPAHAVALGLLTVGVTLVQLPRSQRAVASTG